MFLDPSGNTPFLSVIVHFDLISNANGTIYGMIALVNKVDAIVPQKYEIHYYEKVSPTA